MMRIATVTLVSPLRSRKPPCETQAVGKDGKRKKDACEPKAVGSDGKPLAGAAKSSFMKKCQKDA
jgi:hypothetical protein